MYRTRNSLGQSFSNTAQFRVSHTIKNDEKINCSIEHTFIDCRESVKLYSQIISWFNQCQGTTITLSNEQIVFRDIHHVTDALSDPERRRLDLLIILVKQCMYSSKHLQKELSLDELVNKLTIQWKLEKCA